MKKFVVYLMCTLTIIVVSFMTNACGKGSDALIAVASKERAAKASRGEDPCDCCPKCIRWHIVCSCDKCCCCSPMILNVNHEVEFKCMDSTCQYNENLHIWGYKGVILEQLNSSVDYVGRGIGLGVYKETSSHCLEHKEIAPLIVEPFPSYDYYAQIAFNPTDKDLIKVGFRYSEIKEVAYSTSPFRPSETMNQLFNEYFSERFDSETGFFIFELPFSEEGETKIFSKSDDNSMLTISITVTPSP